MTALGIRQSVQIRLTSPDCLPTAGTCLMAELCSPRIQRRLLNERLDGVRTVTVSAARPGPDDLNSEFALVRISSRGHETL